MTIRPQRMDGYVRVSRVNKREGPGYISPSIQREQIEGWAKLRDVEIAAWHEDFDQSGGKLDRPGLDAFLQRLETGLTDGVIVAKLDRLSRLGVGDALKLVERITDAGGSISAVDLGLDPTTPFGEFGMTIMLAMGRMERRRLADSWEIARQRANARGVMVGPTPYGYERREDGTLALHPIESVHMRRAYEIAATRGPSAANRYLGEHTNGRFWTITTTRRALGRRVYLGETHTGPFLNAEAHEPLVSRALWEAAQHEPRTYRLTTGRYPLSGIPLCATCGNPLVAGTKTSGGKLTYRCCAAQTLYRGERCTKAAQVVAERLEDHLRERLRPILKARVSIADGNDDLALAERVVLEAEGELDAFAADLTIRRALGGRYQDHLASRVEQVEQARTAYRSLARKAQSRERFNSADVLDGDDPVLFAELLRGMTEITIVVATGRAPLSERVRIFPFDGELPTWE
jgi:site-specific DNA recombinase